MDNPQHYQPLSHALHPPLPPSQSRSPYPPASVVYTPPLDSATAPAGHQSRNPTRREEEEEEEEQDDDDDEGMVEEQLNHNDADNQESDPASPPRTMSAMGPDSQTAHNQDTMQHPEPKRRPGRPRGSKNRKVRMSQTARESSSYPGGLSGPPPHPDINSQNQQYYEFQWRILNLCAEFYGAAEELVKGTNPLVIAQCYHMGPTTKVDPLALLSEAKHNCDTLLANPAQLVSNPPPPMYPMIPPLYPHGAPTTSALHPSSTPAASGAASSTSKPVAAPPPVITNPQSFVVPLGPQAPYPTAQYPVYAASQYPTTPYYQYPYSHPTYYSNMATMPPVAPVAASTPPVASSSAMSATVASPLSTSGAWSDEEVEKLKRLAEESKAMNSSGEIDWEHVTRNFGDKRTRHQVLIKATALGLKESSTRGVKRRRGEDGTTDSAPAMASLPAQPPASSSANNTTNPTPIQHPHQHSTASPSHSQSASTPAASPALQNQQRPPSSSAKGPPNVSGAAASGSGSSAATAAVGTGTTTTTATNMPWPMPTVATNAPSPVMAAAAGAGVRDPQRTSYYRPRPTQGDATGTVKAGAGQQQQQQQQAGASTAIHHYMYVPNGHSGARPGRDPGN